MSKQIDFERFYSFFGCDFSSASESNVKSTCPFFDCEKENHFFVNTKTGQFECKKCAKKGNHYSFMTQYHQLCVEYTTDEHYEELKDARGTPLEVSKLAKWAINPEGTWHVPYYAMTSSSLVNIGRFNPGSSNVKNRYRIFKAPELPLVLYRLFESPKIGNDVIVTEGEHDIKAIYAAYRANKNRPGSTLMASPGNNWKKEWNKQLLGKNVMFFADNDAGGEDFIKSITKNAKGFNYSFANWTIAENYWQENFGEVFEGKDPRDVWNLSNNKSEVLPIFLDMMQEATKGVEGTPEDIETQSAYTTDVAEIAPLSSRKLFQSRIKEAMYTNTSIMQSIDLVLAACISVLVPGEPIWVFLYGPPSCLSGSTQVILNRAGLSRKRSIKSLYEKFHAIKGRPWNPEIKTYIQQRFPDNTIRKSEVLDVIAKGVKKVFKVTTKSGHEIVATADHKFLTPTGWKQLKNLTTSDSLYVNNKRRKATSYKKKVTVDSMVGLRYHPHATCLTERRSDGWKVPTHRLVVEANMNGVSLEEFVHECRYNADNLLQFLDPKTQHVHHKDRDRKNHSLDNLQVMDNSEHKVLHCHEDNFKANVLEKLDLSKIKSIIPYGEEEVYDITVEEPNNFVANGIVVHNCGKSLLIEAFGGSNDYFEYASKVTATSLVSGWKPQNGEEDSSTLPKINNKTLFIKDLTVLLGMPEAIQQQLWDLLRDAYDGFIKVIFGNGKTFTATGIKFGIVAGVTNAIHARNDSDMGERFLKIDYLGDTNKFSEDEHMDAAWESMDKKKENKRLLLETVLGYYKHLITDFSVDKLVPGSEVDVTVRNKLKRLAQLVAKLRAKVVKDRHEGMKMRPVPEVATRLYLQFGVLIRCLAYVRQDKTVTEDTYIAFRKIAFDSTNGLNLEVIDYLYKNKGASRFAMINDLRIPSTRMHQILSDFDQLNIITKAKEENGKGGGRDSYRYTLSEEIMECLTVSKPTRKKPLKSLPKKVLPKRKVRSK
jgi:5S rRNA maturation endonuclease (ribonuclease M5)